MRSERRSERNNRKPKKSLHAKQESRNRNTFQGTTCVDYPDGGCGGGAPLPAQSCGFHRVFAYVLPGTTMRRSRPHPTPSGCATLRARSGCSTPTLACGSSCPTCSPRSPGPLWTASLPSVEPARSTCARAAAAALARKGRAQGDALARSRYDFWRGMDAQDSMCRLKVLYHVWHGVPA